MRKPLGSVPALFTPRIAGEFLLGICDQGARWYRFSDITSLGIEGTELNFRLNEEEGSIAYICGRLPNPQQADKELFDLLVMMDPSTQADKEEV